MSSLVKYSNSIFSFHRFSFRNSEEVRDFFGFGCFIHDDAFRLLNSKNLQLRSLYLSSSWVSSRYHLSLILLLLMLLFLNYHFIVLFLDLGFVRFTDIQNFLLFYWLGYFLFMAQDSLPYTIDTVVYIYATVSMMWIYAAKLMRIKVTC